jgi:hypothetical protein
MKQTRNYLELRSSKCRGLRALFQPDSVACLRLRQTGSNAPMRSGYSPSPRTSPHRSQLGEWVLRDFTAVIERTLSRVEHPIAGSAPPPIMKRIAANRRRVYIGRPESKRKRINEQQSAKVALRGTSKVLPQSRSPQHRLNLQ